VLLTHGPYGHVVAKNGESVRLLEENDGEEEED
jgi:hypothetical protein